MPEQMKTVWGDVSDRQTVPFRLMAFGDIDGAVGWWELRGILHHDGRLEISRLEHHEQPTDVEHWKGIMIQLVEALK